jgi:hypothetical protein
LAFFFKDPQHAKVVSIGIFIVGFLGILLYDQWLQWKARGSQVANEDPAPRSPAEADQHASTRCASVP